VIPKGDGNLTSDTGESLGVHGVEIEFGAVPRGLPAARCAGVLWQASRSRLVLEVPEVARYLVEDGRRIRIDPAPGASLREVSQFARGTPLAALLFQRGHLAVQAAAASTCGSGILIAGRSAAGKSTLLAALLQRGWRLLADDLAVVGLDSEGSPVVPPTSDQVRLFPDARERLGVAGGPWAIASEPAPLRAIWCLSSRGGEGASETDVEGADRFRSIAALAYNTRIADALLDRVTFFRLAVAMSASATIRRLHRPMGRWSVDELADLIDRSVEQLNLEST